MYGFSWDLSALCRPSLPPKSCLVWISRWKSLQIKFWIFHKRQKPLSQQCRWCFSDSGIASYNDWTEVEAMSRCWCSNGFAAISVKLTLMQATAGWHPQYCYYHFHFLHASILSLSLSPCQYKSQCYCYCIVSVLCWIQCNALVTKHAFIAMQCNALLVKAH